MAATSEEEGSPPILSDYVKLYNAVVEFKHNLATVFLEKGLLEEKSKLEAINAVTMGTDAVNMMSQVQQFTADIVLAFNLIAELIKSNISNKTTVQAAENTVDAESQTDLTPGNLVIQALDTSLVKTEKDPDEYWDELHPTFSPVGVMESAKTPETAQPTRRKSARTLKRKALESKPAVGAKKRKQGEVVKIQGRGGDQKKILALVPSDLARAHKGGVLATNLYERTPDGMFKCKECGKKATLQTNIRKHLRKHTGEKPYQCSLCPAMFAYPRSLKRHELVHKGVRPFKCPECDKSFFDQTALRTHQRVHTSDRPYICQICGDRFRQSEGLKGHMRRHTGDKPFVCERCGMAFAAKRSLVRHIRVHTGERPYSCDQCVAAFADWTTLHNHKLVHRDPSAENAGDWQVTDGDGKIVVSETKPYQCQFCGIRYRQPLSLKRHLRIHATNNTDVKKSPVKKPRKRKQQDVEEGEIEEPTALHLQYRPYACELCGERFKHLRGYQTHKTKHENGTFTAKKTPAKRTKRDTALAQISNQEIEQAATILASVAVNSTSVTTSNNLPVIHAQPSSEAVTIIDASSITAMSMADTTQLFVADAPMVSNAGEVIHHFMPGDVTQVIRYPDGTLSHVTTLVPTHNPQPPPPPQPNISVMQPIDQLGNVTVLFETQDGNVVVDQTGSLA
ncbi:zinc finger protein 583-like isoform X2 [Littorina saxatilis]|uniref:zinc finger protein 583-like isoform X2 n=1 Tax=Littorina saxatilis TaxID=31220 RepID=UPI0038B4278E